MKKILKSLRRKKVFTILTIIQISLMVFCLIEGFSIGRPIDYNEKRLNKLFGKNDVLLIKNDEMYSTEVGKCNKKYLLEFYEYIKSNKNIAQYGMYWNSQGTIEKANGKGFKNEEIIEFIKKQFKNRTSEKNNIEETPYAKIDNNENKYASIYMVNLDYGFLKLSDISIVEGRNFILEDFQNYDKDNIPILVGNQYKKILKVGDKIQSYGVVKNDGIVTLNVIGILDKNVVIPQDSQRIVADVKDMNYAIIKPIFEREFLQDEFLTYFYIGKNLIFIPREPKNIEKVRNEVDEKLEKLGLNMSCNLMSKNIDDYRQYMSIGVKETFFKSLILGILIFGGLVSACMIYVLIKKEDIGIKIACGATKFSIVKNLFFEMLTLVLISIIPSSVYFTIKKHKALLYGIERIDGVVLFKVALILLIATLVAILFPSITIFKLQPKELIGGEGE